MLSWFFVLTSIPDPDALTLGHERVHEQTSLPLPHPVRLVGNEATKQTTNRPTPFEPFFVPQKMSEYQKFLTCRQFGKHYLFFSNLG